MQPGKSEQLNERSDMKKAKTMLRFVTSSGFKCRRFGLHPDILRLQDRRRPETHKMKKAKTMLRFVTSSGFKPETF